MVLCPITSLAIRCIMMAPRPRPSSQSGPRSHGANARPARTAAVAASGTPAPDTLGVAFRPGPGARLAFAAQQPPGGRSSGLCNNPEPGDSARRQGTRGPH